MLTFFADYGIFLAKTLTLLASFLTIVIVIAVIVARQRKPENQLEINKINEKFDAIRDALKSAILSKEALKKAEKAKKKTKKKEKHKSEKDKPCLFVIEFKGDVRASEVKELREAISAIITVATPKDEVLAVIESPGGMVHSYGLAASQLDRIKSRGIPLTAAIDKVAASGGYMMACVASNIIAAPFAVIGSIGVIGQIPNFHRLLEKYDIDYEQHTAGEYKRTLTMFGKNTDASRKKFQEELDETHALFKQFITEHRPQVDIKAVATGEHWYALDAQGKQLVDEIKTSDDYIMEKLDTHQIFEVSYTTKEALSDKIGHFLHQTWGLVFRRNV